MLEAVAILEREKTQAVVRADRLSVELRDLKNMIRSLDDAISVLSGHQPEPRPPRVSSGELKALITQTLMAYGTVGATAREIADAVSLSRAGTTEASVSSTLSRMKNEDHTCENRQGKWYAKTKPLQPESSVSDRDIDDILTDRAKAEATGGSSFADDLDDDDTPF